VLIIDGAGGRGDGFGSVDGDEVADHPARVFELAGSLDMGRDIAAVGLQGLARALAVDELVVERTGREQRGRRLVGGELRAITPPVLARIGYFLPGSRGIKSGEGLIAPRSYRRNLVRLKAQRKIMCGIRHQSRAGVVG
jgi:hypothetical protein